LILSAFRGASNFREFNLFRRFFHRRLALRFVAVKDGARSLSEAPPLFSSLP
jgi:hypothetical protein